MGTNGTATVLRPGFHDPVQAAQESFRALLDAMARPGVSHEIRTELEPPHGIDIATAALLLALLDHETPLWLDLGDLSTSARRYFAFHCGCPMASRPEAAGFALVHALSRLGNFDAGTAERPELSTTVIVQVPALVGGAEIRLSGPGIESFVDVAPSGVGQELWDQVGRNAAWFPRGLDFVLVSGRRFFALPRTVRREA